MSRLFSFLGFEFAFELAALQAGAPARWFVSPVVRQPGGSSARWFASPVVRQPGGSPARWFAARSVAVFVGIILIPTLRVRYALAKMLPAF
jgi:hypothetical protein